MTKSLLIAGFILCFLFIVPSQVNAHLAGQPPYLRINGQYTNLYPVPVSSADTFNLPQDLAQGTFTVGEKLQFVMESDKLPAPPEVIKKTTFTWDFGDGSPTLTGLQAEHTYTRMGSFVQIIYADDGTLSQPQLLSSVLINVLPSTDYKLPTPKIYVNQLSPDDPLTQPLKFDLTKPLQFDGSKSQDGTGKIVSYEWDMGDGTTKTSPLFQSSYSSQTNQVFPVLRIKDENGFIADTYIELETGNPVENNAIIRATSNTVKSPQFLPGFSMVLFAIGIGAFLILIGVIIFKKKKGKKIGQHH